MKGIKLQKLKHCPVLILLLFLSYEFACSSDSASAQGWNFTATLTYSGPCGTNVPTIPPIVIPPVLPTQGDCESMRQIILSYEGSTAVYNNQGEYIGLCRVFYTCTPCSGSDIAANISPDVNSPGYISIDGLMQGNAFFSPHQSQAIENWINDYLQRMETLGYPVDRQNLIPIQDFPLTGNSDFDQFYYNQLNDLENSAPATAQVYTNTPVAQQPVETDIPSGTVRLLTSAEQIRQRDEWWDDNGFNVPVQVGPGNHIDEYGTAEAGTTVGEAAILTALGQAPGLSGVIADFMVNTTNETFSGIQGVVSDFTNGNDARALERAENLEGHIVMNAAGSTAMNVVTSHVTGIVTKPVLGLVKGAETVHGYISMALDFWKNKTGN